MSMLPDEERKALLARLTPAVRSAVAVGLPTIAGAIEDAAAQILLDWRTSSTHEAELAAAEARGIAKGVKQERERIERWCEAEAEAAQEAGFDDMAGDLGAILSYIRSLATPEAPTADAASRAKAGRG